MNFYKRFPADYGRKTARLTLMQHGAYTLLLDELYATEQPLPSNRDELYRICRAMSKPEQESVRTVADSFFPIGDDGMRHNRRATQEIADAAPAMEAARLNGKKGGRPKTTTHQEPSGLFNQNPNHSQSEPRTKAPQSSDSPSLRSGEGRASRLPKPFVLPDEWADWATQERPDLDPVKVAAKFADHWHAKPGKSGTKLDWLATWRNWVREERAPQAQKPSATGETPYQRSKRELFEAATGRRTNVIDVTPEFLEIAQ